MSSGTKRVEETQQFPFTVKLPAYRSSQINRISFVAPIYRLEKASKSLITDEI